MWVKGRSIVAAMSQYSRFNNPCLLGIDYGTKWIGIAISTPDLNLAVPHATIQNIDVKVVRDELYKIVKQQRVGGFVVGWPIAIRTGKTTDKGLEVAAFFRDLDMPEIPKTLAQEQYSTVKAKEFAAMKLGQGANLSKQELDKIAATIILQDFLDTLQDEED